MKEALVGVVLVAFVGCGGSEAADKPTGTAGSSGGGSGGAGSAGAGAGMSQGGAQGQAGSGTAGTTAGGGAGGSAAGSGGAGGTGGTGGVSQAFKCPAGAVDAPVLTGLQPKRIEGVPPADAFNNDNNDNTNIEGAVWLGDALYVSEIAFTKPNPPPSRVLKITADGTVSIVIADSGSNGLALNGAGELIGALHSDGTVSKLSLTGAAPVALVSMFMGARFNSPNDLTFHDNGSLYFSDPKWQAAMPNPQTAMRAYRVAPGSSEAVAIEELDQPNGITLSKKQDFLYIGGNQLKKYPVMADGSLGAGTTFVAGGTTDGMVIDCADNLYTTGNGVTVYSPAGMSLGNISVNASATNVAFGGADHKTLYITTQGGKDQKGLWQVAMNVQGMPY